MYDTVPKRARVLVRLDYLMEERLLDENPSGEKAPKRQKLRKDGGFKQSGKKERDTRTARTICFKYEVAMHYRKMQRMKEQGLSVPQPWGRDSGALWRRGHKRHGVCVGQAGG